MGIMVDTYSVDILDVIQGRRTNSRSNKNMERTLIADRGSNGSITEYKKPVIATSLGSGRTKFYI